MFSLLLVRYKYPGEPLEALLQAASSPSLVLYDFNEQHAAMSRRISDAISDALAHISHGSCLHTPNPHSLTNPTRSCVEVSNARSLWASVASPAAFRVAVTAATNKVRSGVRGDDIVVAVREVIRFLEKHGTGDEKYPELAEFVQRYKDGLYRYTAHGACVTMDLSRQGLTTQQSQHARSDSLHTGLFSDCKHHVRLFGGGGDLR